jgi:hypothetical protein
MTSNALPADIRFANEMIGPALGATWGLGFAITTDPARFPGSIGSVSWSGVWGTFFWIDFTENNHRVPTDSGITAHCPFQSQPLTGSDLRSLEQPTSAPLQNSS